MPRLFLPRAGRGQVRRGREAASFLSLLLRCPAQWSGLCAAAGSTLQVNLGQRCHGWGRVFGPGAPPRFWARPLRGRQYKPRGRIRDENGRELGPNGPREWCVRSAGAPGRWHRFRASGGSRRLATLMRRRLQRSTVELYVGASSVSPAFGRRRAGAARHAGDVRYAGAAHRASPARRTRGERGRRAGAGAAKSVVAAIAVAASAAAAPTAA